VSGVAEVWDGWRGRLGIANGGQLTVGTVGRRQSHSVGTVDGTTVLRRPAQPEARIISDTLEV
jgi:hypothetical protein